MNTLKHYIFAIVHYLTKAILKLDSLMFGGKVKKFGKKTVKYFDNKFLSGRLQRKYKRRQIEKSYPQQTTIAVKDYILAQYDNDRFSDYHMMDLAHRLFAIEQFYGKNEFGYNLYRKMQEISGGNTYENWLQRFQNLIQEYDKTKTFNAQYPLISFINNWNLKDGAHRLALAYYHGTEFIPVQIENEWRDRRWSFNWLWSGEHGVERFSADEIKLATEKINEVLQDCNYDYVGAIWPPAMPFKEEITKDINLYGKYATLLELPMGNCKVVEFRDVEYDKADFLGFMRLVYKEDIITEQNLLRKYNLILSAMPRHIEKLPVRLLRIHIDHPCIERREENNSAQSKAVVDIKHAIRTRYKDRIPNYQYDICFHLSDNYQQSKFCKLGLEMSRDASELFDELNKKWNYVICKTEKRIAPNFPYYYYYYSDADIIIEKKDISACADYIEQWLKQKYTDNWFHVDRVSTSNSIGVILKLRGFRIIYLDLQTTEHFGMTKDFTRKCISMRIKSENAKYYVCPPEIDILIRAVEYLNANYKVWHREYIIEHILSFREDILRIAFGEENSVFTENVKQLILNIQNEQ